ncbi:MAG: hypothetical protein KGS00_08035 [Alphaproteobacteria bacterium]|nr:hypothetical protein [Alphaproteobacteria bacterium]
MRRYSGISICVLMGLAVLAATASGCATAQTVQSVPTSRAETLTVMRIGDGPIIHSGLHPSIGENIQGPSLIRVPEWVPDRLGNYYLYFADHKGGFIRLAYANDLRGPWTIHPPGALRLNQTPFAQTPPAYTAADLEAFRTQIKSGGMDEALFKDLALDAATPHIASPDVHVDTKNRRIVMYYHGLETFGRQTTRVAISKDGQNFVAMDEELGRTYWRAFNHDGMTYAIAMPGVFYRSNNALQGFEQGPTLFKPSMRHAAVFKRDKTLFVVWTEVGGEPPERLLISKIDVSGPWESWRVSETRELLRPERPWEGADLPLTPSFRSTAPGRVNQLRDPAIFEEDNKVYLLYAIAGESGIAIAEIKGLSASASP